jgi:hypothetical protein
MHPHEHIGGVGRIKAFQRCPCPNAGPCECAILHDKRDFVDIIEGSPDGKIILDYPGGESLKSENLSQDVTKEKEPGRCPIAGSEDGGRGNE